MTLLFALLLGAAALAAWWVAGAARPYATRNLRFAALLYAALSVAGIIASIKPGEAAQLSLIVALLVSALGPPLLTIAAYGTLSRPFASPWAAAALIATCIAGISAMMTGYAVLALIPQTIAILLLFLVGLKASRPIALRLCLSALALFAGMLAVVADNRDAGAIFSLFSAAGLLGVTRALVRTGSH